MGIISRVPWPLSSFKCGRLTQVHGRYVTVFDTPILVSVRANLVLKLTPLVAIGALYEENCLYITDCLGAGV